MNKLLIILCFVFVSNTTFGQIENGATVPNFTVKDMNGNTHELYKILESGKYVSIDFFTEWCPSCPTVAKRFDDLYKKYGCNSGNVFMIAMDAENGTVEQIKAFKAKAGISDSTMPTIKGSDGGSATKALICKSCGYPTIQIIAPNKKMLEKDVWGSSGFTTALWESKFPAGALTAKACNLSVNENEISASLKVYPNPASDVLNISVDQINSVQIIDTTGKVVFRSNYQSVNEVSLSVSSLEKGMYFLNITTEKGNVSSKFIK